MLTTLSIVGVLSGFGSGVYGAVHEYRATAQINQFLAHLSLARSEAMKRGTEVAICPSSDGRVCDSRAAYRGWQNGALLFADNDGDGRLEREDSVVRVLERVDRLVIHSTRGTNKIVFQPNGLAPGTNRTFTICAATGTSKPRYVIMSNTGRARVSATPPKDSPAADCS